MRNLVVVLFAGLVVCAVVSCKKSNDTMKVDNTKGTLLGRWNLVSDSSYIQFAMPGIDTFYIRKYIGVPGDYYNFETGGKLSVREGTFSIDTASYTLDTAANKLVIAYCHNCVQFLNDGAGYFTIKTLTAHTLVFYNSGFYPEGAVSETMIFSR
jgi:hypothetical protein